MATTYQPGAAYAVVGARGAALLDPHVAPELVAAVWGALGDVDGGGVGAVLQVLTGAFGTSLTTIPPFAVADRQADGVHLAVRGGFVVRVHGGAGEHAVSGAGVSTWHERLEVDADEVELVEPGLLGVHPPLPLGTGVVLAASVRTDLRLTAPVSVAAQVSAAQVSAVQVSVAQVSAVQVSAVQKVVAEEVVVPMIVAQDDPADLPTDTRLPEPEEPEELEEPEPLAPAHEEGVESTRTDVDGDYDFLWGSTVLRSIEDAAVRADPEEDDDGEPVAPAHLPSVSALVAEHDHDSVALPMPVAAPSTPSPARVPAPVPAPVPALVTAQPTAPAAPPQAGWTPPTLLGQAALAPLAALGDHDGETILAGGVAALRTDAPPVPAPRAPEPPATSGAIAVLARRCVDGHPNPPEASTCLGCGRALDGDAVRMIRPTLGRVLLSTGQEIPLDRPLVVGRKPRVSRVQNDNLPRLVTVPSPEQDISRSHLEVRLEGWHVLLVDLGSTNGSMLLRPGQPPVRLHPQEATLAVAGDVVDLGDGIQMTFADLP